MKGTLPPKPFLGAVLARATWLWLGLHAAGATGSVASGMPVVSTHWISLLASLWIFGFTALGVHILNRRRGEALILANLGFSQGWTAALVIAWCTVLEGCLQLAIWGLV